MISLRHINKLYSAIQRDSRFNRSISSLRTTPQFHRRPDNAPERMISAYTIGGCAQFSVRDSGYGYSLDRVAINTGRTTDSRAEVSRGAICAIKLKAVTEGLSENLPRLAIRRYYYFADHPTLRLDVARVFVDFNASLFKLVFFFFF